jgi:hypothetical protein
MATDVKAERIIFIEYQDGRPFEVVTASNDGKCRTYYDVEWCRRDQCLYIHESGGSTSPIAVRKGTDFWACADAPIKIEDGATRRKRSKFRKKLQTAIAGDWVAGISGGECTYCPVCEDYLPTEDTYHPCAHIWWCDDAGWWSTPGERCPWDCADCRAHGREVRPAPPMTLVAQGYGRAASGLAALVRSVLAKHGLTPESLARKMGWCARGKSAIAAALRGEASPEVDADALDSVARRLPLGEADRVGLREAFGFSDE